jgi:type III restriction enzyme
MNIERKILNQRVLLSDIWRNHPYSSVGGGFERDFMTEIIEPSADIMAFAKLDKRHALKIPYRDEHGILREYEVDFLIKTKEVLVTS